MQRHYGVMQSVDLNVNLFFNFHLKNFSTCMLTSERAVILHSADELHVEDDLPLSSFPNPSRIQPCCTDCINMTSGPVVTVGAKQINIWVDLIYVIKATSLVKLCIPAIVFCFSYSTLDLFTSFLQFIINSEGNYTRNKCCNWCNVVYFPAVLTC